MNISEHTIPIVAYGFEFDNIIENIDNDIHLCKSIHGLPVYCSILVISSDINEIFCSLQHYETQNDHLFHNVEKMIAIPSREYYVKNNSLTRTVCKWQIVYWNKNGIYNDLHNLHNPNE